MATMFKCVVSEHFGPFCGHGGYGTETTIGTDRSPKKAVEKATNWRKYRNGGSIRRTSGENPETGICGGGVPILREFELYKNNKLIYFKCD